MKENQTISHNYLLQGDSSYNQPPGLTPGASEMYDSNVDELLNPALYIVSARDQCYPRYIIEYKVMKSTL